MEQRPLRLGDIVDDYCPRERRITNHVIVAIVNEGIRQTRCTTCEAEHVYKAAKVPRRRKADADEEGGEPPGQLITPRAADSPAPLDPGDPAEGVTLQADAAADAPAMAVASDVPPAEPQPSEEVWHTHRRLIRATLPRTDGEPPPPRPIPEFTMHQRPGRHQGRGQWHGNGNMNGNINGHGRPERRQGRGNQPHGHDNGQGQGQGGRPGGRSGGRHRGHKRSR
jgi:hypothetical protein